MATLTVISISKSSNLKSVSLLGIVPLRKKIVNVLMFYILRHVVPGLLIFLDWLLTGKFHRKPYFPIISSSYFIRLRSLMYFFWFYIKKITIIGDIETNPGPQNLNVVKKFKFVTGI